MADAPHARRLALAALVLAVLALGTWLRFHALGAKSLWLDEAQTMFYVDRPLGETLAAVRAHDAHPPLYYLLLNLWLGGSQDGARARAFSALASALTLLVFWDMARRLLTPGAALVAALVLAVSAFQVYFAQEARHYALATLFVVLGWWCLVRLLERVAQPPPAVRGCPNPDTAEGGCATPSPRRTWPLWLGLALANAAALYTFYYTLFAIVAQGVALLALWRAGGRRLLPRWAAWQLLPAVLFAAYLPAVLKHVERLRELAPSTGHGASGGREVCATLGQFTTGLLAEVVETVSPGGGVRLRMEAWAFAVGIPLVLLAALSLRDGRSFATSRLGLIWLAVPLVCVAIFPLRGHVYEPKHLAFAAPALALLAGAGFGAARRSVSFASAIVVLLWVGLNALSDGLCCRPAVQKEDWRGLVAAMTERVQPGDVVIFDPPYVKLAFAYYYKAMGHNRELPRVVPVEAPVAGRPFALPQALARRRIWHLEASSRVAFPNGEVTVGLSKRPVLYEDLRIGLLGYISAILHEEAAADGPSE